MVEGQGGGCLPYSGTTFVSAVWKATSKAFLSSCGRAGMGKAGCVVVEPLSIPSIPPTNTSPGVFAPALRRQGSGAPAPSSRLPRHRTLQLACGDGPAGRTFAVARSGPVVSSRAEPVVAPGARSAVVVVRSSLLANGSCQTSARQLFLFVRAPPPPRPPHAAGPPAPAMANPQDYLRMEGKVRPRRPRPAAPSANASAPRAPPPPGTWHEMRWSPRAPPRVRSSRPRRRAGRRRRLGGRETPPGRSPWVATAGAPPGTRVHEAAWRRRRRKG